jgi:hypothetical protein
LTLTDLMSFRNAAHLVRRVRQGGLDARTPVTTLADRVEREGAAVQTWIDQKTVTTLAQHHFTPEGVPTLDTTVQPLADDQGRLPQTGSTEYILKLLVQDYGLNPLGDWDTTPLDNRPMVNPERTRLARQLAQLDQKLGGLRRRYPPTAEAPEVLPATAPKAAHTRWASDKAN